MTVPTGSATPGEPTSEKQVARKSRYSIPVPTWTCPHCGFRHKPADLLRTNGEDLLCKNCNGEFPDKPDDVRTDRGNANDS
jgi:hypothetical protein